MGGPAFRTDARCPPLPSRTPTFRTTPAARAAALYDPEFVRLAGRKLADLLADHFRSVQSRETAVLNWRHPAENAADAGAILDAGTAGPSVARPGGRRGAVRCPGEDGPRPRAEPAFAAVRRASGAAAGPARGAVRRRRGRHEPADGDLRDGAVGDGRRGRARRTSRGEARLRARDVRRRRHARRVAREHDCVADGPERRARRRLGGGGREARAAAGARRARRGALLRQPGRRHPRPGHPERRPAEAGRPSPDRPPPPSTRRSPTSSGRAAP